AADLFQHLPAGVRTAAGRLDAAEKGVQLVEVQLTELEDVAAVDREQQSGRTNPRAVAVGAGALDHHLVEPFLHPRVRFAALPVAPVMTLDAPGDAVEADLAAVLIVAAHLRVWRRDDPDPRGPDAVEDRAPRVLC